MNTSEMATCPYNPNHSFAKFKLFPHLQRCKDAKKSNRKLYQCKKDIMVMFFKEDKHTHYNFCQYCSRSESNLNQTDTTGIEEIRQKMKNIRSQSDMISINMDFNITSTNESKFDINEIGFNEILEESNLMKGSDSICDIVDDSQEEKNTTILY
jgi:hypothetical protein